MAKTNAEHQADFRRRRDKRMVELEIENARLKLAARHDACDALERELRAEVATVRRRITAEIERVDQGEEWPDGEWKKGYRHALTVARGFTDPKPRPVIRVDGG